MVSRIQTDPVRLIQATAEVTKTPVKNMAYGRIDATSPDHATFRLERGHPFKRTGKLVFATPQFKSLTIYAQDQSQAQLPSTTQSNILISYPSRIK